MEELEQILGYTFKNKALLKQALTHGSVCSDKHKNYQRLEFLGDRILGLAAARLLFLQFPDDMEGSLSPRHTKMVCKETVARVALDLHLDKFIRVENSFLRKNQNVLCDVMEAVLGAVSIDSDAEEGMKLVERFWENFVSHSAVPPRDSKSKLQEYLHRHKLGTPVYRMKGKKGTEHEPVFFVELKVGDYISEGSGKNKKEAEKYAAGFMLQQLREIYDK